ncbi:MAG: sugar ABC transporter permease [Propionibacteriaceae bacterium]|nr:sugar ABC transporter permease [Propionibacteriaceae bacterium]
MTRIVPLISSVAWSLDSRGGGFGAYREVLSSSAFQGSLRTTLLFNLVLNPVQIALSLVLALVLAQQIPAAGVWRAAVLAPIAAPQVVSVIVWGVWLRPSGGLINSFLAVFGLAPQPFLTSPYQAIWCLGLIASWIGVGYWMVFLIAGIREVPDELLEAAALDGASWLRQQISIVVPLIRRQLAFVLVADTVANFLLFVPVQVLTQGGPAQSTNLVMYEIYRQAYVFADQTTAAVETVILLVIMTAIVGLQFWLLQGRRE